MSKRIDEELKKAFPADVTKSVMVDILGSVKGDKKEAMKIAKAMGQQAEEETQRARERKISELQGNFTELSKEVIVRTLAENEWDVDRCIVPLFEYSAKDQVEEKKKQDVEKNNKSREEAKQFLKTMFSTIPEAKIQEMLDDNEGDVEATTDQLMELISKLETGDSDKLKIEQERETKIDTLRNKFPEYITEKEIVSILEQNKWDVKLTVGQLLNLTETRKIEHLKRLFKNVDNTQIRKALQATNWSPVNAMKILTEQTSKKDSPPTTTTTTTTQDSEPKDDFLKRSLMLGDELAAIIAKKTDVEPIDLIRAKIDLAIRGEIPGVHMENRANPYNVMPEPVSLGKSIQPVKEAPLPSPIDQSNLIQDSVLKRNVLLATEKKRFDIGESIKVKWSVLDDVDATTSDWIGIYKTGITSVKEYVTYYWVKTTDLKQGELVFPSPSEFGEYEFKYCRSRGYEISGISESIIVGPLVDLAAFVTDDGKIEASFEQKAGKMHPNAWIALFSLGETENKKYINYNWISNSVDHTLIFDPHKAGSYELRFFPSSRSYIDVARCSVVVSGKDVVEIVQPVSDVVNVECSVETADPNVDYVWIGLYLVEQENHTQWRRYKYIKEKKCVVTFKTPKTAGTYEARLFANKTYEQPLCKSSHTFVVSQ
eukprot:TRINITY_DN1440_c0_g1_i1.p1 TRINITY_DN1440_c0_g1~~TRINITY_DN1440_c0_g1_i1.p1  ORF type:complete len:655 (-),score=193.12 TRINITY_DN1440_c0_g1_i1:24-1988(-)